jgi:hypothetical protein
MSIARRLEHGQVAVLGARVDREAEQLTEGEVQVLGWEVVVMAMAGHAEEAFAGVSAG